MTNRAIYTILRFAGYSNIHVNINLKVNGINIDWWAYPAVTGYNLNDLKNATDILRAMNR